MIDGIPIIDAHLHPARIPTLKPSMEQWAPRFDRSTPVQELYDEEGALVPERFDSFLADEGVDLAILLCEYSPKVTGIQPVEDLLPLLKHNPRRFRFLAALNPYYHHPIPEELERQLELGAVGLKIHPVHGGFPPNDRALYPAYLLCQQYGLPVVFHCGTSVFPGAANKFADPVLMDEVSHDFPDLTIVLAHGGRGWWYDAAAFISMSRPNVWIELSGLPPKKLPVYYQNFDLNRLAQKFIFATDWPGAPGIRANAQAVTELDFDRATLENILYRNALRVYGLQDAWDLESAPDAG